MGLAVWGMSMVVVQLLFSPSTLTQLAINPDIYMSVYISKPIGGSMQANLSLASSLSSVQNWYRRAASLHSVSAMSQWKCAA